ncbi:MAG: DUF2442 domain-containing protein [Desulfovibrio sp.]|jgi:hypothetical protein|nr:DUF2442 domain-containing protein [Desulfovibrio sp.]
MLQPKIVDIEAFDDYTLRLIYANGEEKFFDVRPYICGEWFGRLRDTSYFKTVRVLPDGSGIEWADGQDIAPHELYEAG